MSIVFISVTNVTKLSREELPSHPWPHPWEAPHLRGYSFVWIFHPLVFHLSVQQISGCELSVQWVCMPVWNPKQSFVFSSRGERRPVNGTHKNESIGLGMTTPEKWVGRANEDCGFTESVVPSLLNTYILRTYYAWAAGHWRYTGGWVALLLKSS